MNNFLQNQWFTAHTTSRFLPHTTTSPPVLVRGSYVVFTVHWLQLLPSCMHHTTLHHNSSKQPAGSLQNSRTALHHQASLCRQATPFYTILLLERDCFVIFSFLHSFLSGHGESRICNSFLIVGFSNFGSNGTLWHIVLARSPHGQSCRAACAYWWDDHSQLYETNFVAVVASGWLLRSVSTMQVIQSVHTYVHPVGSPLWAPSRIHVPHWSTPDSFIVVVVILQMEQISTGRRNRSLMHDTANMGIFHCKATRAWQMNPLVHQVSGGPESCGYVFRKADILLDRL